MKHGQPIGRNGLRNEHITAYHIFLLRLIGRERLPGYSSGIKTGVATSSQERNENDEQQAHVG